MTNFTYLFGIYRSGTTVLSRLLKGSDFCSSASDPLRPFFNAYTNKLIDDKHSRKNLFFPFRESFYHKKEYLDILRESSFSEKIDTSDIGNIIQTLALNAKPFSPIFSDYLINENHPKHFLDWSDLYNYLLKILVKCYSLNNNVNFCIKEVWASEAAFPLINKYCNNTKFIFLIRNPLDIYSSSKTGAGNYPILFLSRHWRKACAVAEYFKIQYPSKTLILKYEDFCNYTDDKFSLIKNFIKNDPDSNKKSELPIPLDDFNEVFVKNSSYKNDSRSHSIDTRSIGKWKKNLSTSEVDWLLYFCRSSFLFKYYPDLESKSLPSNKYPKRKKNEVADWFKKTFPNYEDDEILEIEFKKEQNRFNKIGHDNDLILNKDNLLNNINDQL